MSRNASTPEGGGSRRCTAPVRDEGDLEAQTLAGASELTAVSDNWQARLRAAVQALRNEGLVVLLEEGPAPTIADVVAAAENATSAIVNRMSSHGHGLVYVLMSEARCDRLGLPALTPRDPDRWITGARTTVEARVGVSTGISAADRARTLRVAGNPATTSHDLVSPGHVVPVAAIPGGIRSRAGRTEAAVDLMRLADMTPVAAAIELVRDDGDPVSAGDAQRFALAESAPVVYVEEVLKGVLASVPLRVSDHRIAESTRWGKIDITTIQEGGTGREHHVIAAAGLSRSPRVRAHVACPFGDVFSACPRGCGDRLTAALGDASRGRETLVYIAGGTTVDEADQSQALATAAGPLALRLASLAGIDRPEPATVGVTEELGH